MLMLQGSPRSREQGQKLVGFIEKIARGARHIKRAARADLHRFKALIETAGQETGAWRGVIEDGELVEEHDPSYDQQRQYADIEELTQPQDEGTQTGLERCGDHESSSLGQDGEMSACRGHSPAGRRPLGNPGEGSGGGPLPRRASPAG